MEFLEMSWKEARDQLEENYRQHESMVKAMKQDNSPVSKRRDSSPSKIESLQSELLRVSEEY